MKSLYEHLEDRYVICESFGSSIIEMYWESIRGTFPAKILFQWDKISDNDLKKVELDDAIKMARKRKERHVILWFNNNRSTKESFIGISDGTLILCSNNWRSMNNVNRFYDYSNIVYELIDPDKFDTKTLKSMRFEAKQNALALKSDDEVRRENMRRYEEIKAEKHKDTNLIDAMSWFENAMSTYNTCIAGLTEKLKENLTDPEFSNVIKLYRNQMTDLHNIVDKMISDMTNVKYYDDLNKDPIRPNSTYFVRCVQQYHDKIVEACKYLEKIVSKVQ